MRALQKEYVDQSVWEKSLERIEDCYNAFDHIVVNFSGGKDSTTVLNCTIEVAKKLNRLPVEANFFDEEAIPPETIEYVKRVSQRPEVKMNWFCLPVKHRNACSNEEPFWTCWDPEKKDLWVRELPTDVPIIQEHEYFKPGMSFQEFSDIMWPTSLGKVCSLTGVRTQESFRRYKAVASKRHDNYITSKASSQNIYTAHPIYDWSSEDVWIAVRKFGWDYNTSYDVMNHTKYYNRFLAQRICPPFGEEPIRGLWLFAECWPEMWHKMLKRVPGVATAWRYGNTDVYGIGKLQKPGELTWRQYLELIADNYDSETRKLVAKNINDIIRRHYNKTNDLIPEEDPVHPLTGTSWQFLCKLAIKGDLKGRTGPTLENKAITEQQRLGIPTFQEAMRIYGKKGNPNARKNRRKSKK